jgi:hypothetical protein
MRQRPEVAGDQRESIAEGPILVIENVNGADRAGFTDRGCKNNGEWFVAE